MLSSAMQAQEKTQSSDKNILNHMDIGVNVGSLGIGVDVAMPIGNYVRVRAGYNYMPRFTLHSDFNIETRNGSIQSLISKANNIDAKLDQYGVDITQPQFKEYKDLLDKFRESNTELRDYVKTDMRPNLHQFKFMVDVLPFKNNKHWSFTAGFFVGPSDVGEAYNKDEEKLILEGIAAYNKLYVKYCQEGIKGSNGSTELHDGNRANDPFFKTGIAGFNLGKFADGDMALMVPNEDGTFSAEMKVSKVRPYLGFGYNMHLSKNKKWKLNVDAGILFLCGKPNVYVDNIYKIDKRWSADAWDNQADYEAWKADQFDNDSFDIVRWNEDYDYSNPDAQPMWLIDEPQQHVDILNDVHDIPGKVGDIVNTISKFKVYPNISATFSYRLF